MPPLYPITQITEHLTIPNPAEHDEKSFAPFLIHHCLSIQPSYAFISLPYLHCPSVRDNLEKRCCSTCDIYFASITIAAENRRAVHNSLAEQMRPSRIATRRATELHCASDNGLEWSVIEGASDFAENHMGMLSLYPIVTHETTHESSWTQYEKVFFFINFSN